MKNTHKKLIEKYVLTCEYDRVIEKWGMLRPKFIIKIFSKEFEYFASHNDYKERKEKLSNEDLLFAFRCVIQDAFSYLEVMELPERDAIIEFGLNFGYINSADDYIIYLSTRNPEEYLSDNTIESIKALYQAYHGCSDTYYKLCKSNLEMSKVGDFTYEDFNKILEELSEAGIE